MLSLAFRFLNVLFKDREGTGKFCRGFLQDFQRTKKGRVTLALLCPDRLPQPHIPADLRLDRLRFCRDLSQLREYIFYILLCGDLLAFLAEVAREKSTQGRAKEATQNGRERRPVCERKHENPMHKVPPGQALTIYDIW